MVVNLSISLSSYPHLSLYYLLSLTSDLALASTRDTSEEHVIRSSVTEN